ncbi:MAG: hypothetical protein Rsou_0629 [Candidatus Ruthia sp. Asou_11_S2]|nr:hypothetical protein [Candidatus Ruthia sp. Asou_11_S2]
MNIAQISFKKANAGDFKKLYQLDRLSDENHHWKLSFFNHQDLIKIAIIANQIVGFVVYQTTDVVEIFRITTHHDFKNQSVATALIEALKQLNKSIILELREGNFKACQLYQKLGFEQISKREKYYSNGKDAKIIQFSTAN